MPSSDVAACTAAPQRGRGRTAAYRQPRQPTRPGQAEAEIRYRSSAAEEESRGKRQLKLVPALLCSRLCKLLYERSEEHRPKKDETSPGLELIRISIATQSAANIELTAKLQQSTDQRKQY